MPESESWTSALQASAWAFFSKIGSEQALRTHWAPWESLSEEVSSFLEAENLRSVPGEEVYRRVVDLFQTRPRIRARFKALLAFHEGEKLREALLRMIAVREQGDPGRRITALHLGGLGRATASELLCLWWPYRFLPQNAASCKGLARMVPVYRRRDLEELPYDSFLSLAGTLERSFRETAVELIPGVKGWITERRYLYFYAFLTERPSKG